MTPELSDFAARLREWILQNAECGMRNGGSLPLPDSSDKRFNELALELFGLQFFKNKAYRKICVARRISPEAIGHWTQIPAVPTGAFKELELTCLLPGERTAVFHSSGTTEQRPSRHFHSAESLAVYEASLLPWFRAHVLADLKSQISNLELMALTPPPARAPHSSLVHMLDVVRRDCGSPESAFVGRTVEDGSWAVDFDAVVQPLEDANGRAVCVVLLGTAFSLVHLLDYMVERNLRFQLPAGSRVMETGGYKGRSRRLPREELHALVAQRLGIPPSQIVCEYGMSELSSQAYDSTVRSAECGVRNRGRVFQFPPWVRAHIVSPDTGREVAEGQTGLIRIFDLANVFSVLAIQTEDLGVRRGDGFELMGRAALAEPRGCSIMAT